MEQIQSGVQQLLDLDLTGLLETYLQLMEKDRLLKRRILLQSDQSQLSCYYSKTLYFDEKETAEAIHALCCPLVVDEGRIRKWIEDYGKKQNITLSTEQEEAVRGIVSYGCSILTGGPGCGKTTTTKTLVNLFLSMHKKVLLAAPTGRAAQRMEEVIGLEAKTIHRLLEFQGGSFKRNKENPLFCDVLVVDECSMLDISLTASLLSAMPVGAQLVMVGDADQLPSVGAGNVLGDLLASGVVPVFTLKEFFVRLRNHTLFPMPMTSTRAGFQRSLPPSRPRNSGRNRGTVSFLIQTRPPRNSCGSLPRPKSCSSSDRGKKNSA